MYRQILESIQGIEIYPVMSFVIFMIVFVLISYKAFRMKSSSVEELSYLPLEDNHGNIKK